MIGAALRWLDDWHERFWDWLDQDYEDDLIF